MTTIVADNAAGFIAADFQATTNDCDRPIYCPKIKRVTIGDAGYLMASSGNEGPASIFEDWFQHGDWDEPLEPMYNLEENDVFTTVILGKDGLHVADKFMRLYRIHDRYYATGTGGCAALAVLIAGCGINTAMETAIKMDPHSGFGYEVVYLDD